MDKDNKTEAQSLPAVAGQVEFGVRPRAWYVERIAPGKRDNGMKLGPWWKQEQAEEWADDRHELKTLYDQAALDGARQAIYEAEAAQLTAPLRARVAELEATEDGAKVAFGHVVEQKRAAEKECMRLHGLLAAAYADIRRMSRA